MKKIISLLITLAMLIACLPVTVMAEDEVVTYAGGSGTSSSPWQIATADQLKLMRDTVNADDGKNDVSKYWVLTADIDLGGEEWEPIGWSKSGSYNHEFSGTFDGAGHTVKNFTITQAAQVKSATDGTYYYNNIGLFGSVLGGTIKNLGVENFTATVNEPDDTSADAVSNVGGIVGRFSGTMTKCYAKNITVQKLDNYVNTSVGAVIGTIRGTSTITDCYVYGVSLSGTSKMLGGAFHSGIENATSNVSKLTNCYASNVTFGGNAQNVYGFGMANSSGVSLTYTNCWSTAADLSGCDNAVSKGTLGATKEGIITALVDNGDGSFVIDKNVNNGYPCLSFEKKALVPATSFDGGTGTQSNPYKIATAEQLMYMRNLVNGEDTNDASRNKYYELTDDIDLGGAEWEPIGYNSNRMFRGKFDGKGHVVKNFKITQPYGGFLAFFGHLDNSGVEISNLGIEKETINVTNSSYIAGFAARGAGKFTNCYVKNLTVSTDYGTVGAFFHSLRAGGTFENCYVYNATITVRRGEDGVSGFVMYAENAFNSTFTNCYTADVTNTGKFTYTLPFSFALSKNNNVNVVHTINNCWSTLALTKSTTVANNADHIINKYSNAVTCQDTDEATKDRIRPAFTGLSGWQVNDKINDGFPSLSFETVEEGSDYVVAAVVPGDNVYVKLIANNNVSGAQVYVATYDINDRLLDVDVAEVVSPYEFTTNVSTSGADTVKVFVWNGNQSPLADAYEGKL